MCSKTLLVLLAGLLLVVSGQANLYPYGTSEQDLTLQAGNDQATSIQLSSPLPYYGYIFDEIYVNTNGILSFRSSFENPVENRFVYRFPLFYDLDNDGKNDEHTLLAAFWADVDTSSSRGRVYYRLSTQTSIINQVNADVRNNFAVHLDYSATWVFVATWEDVSFYEHDTSSSTDPRNTFQILLTTDGTRSFAFLLYEKIEWVAGTLIGGDPIDGSISESIYQAVLGFNRGDGLTSYTQGFPSDRLLLPTRSNINVDGVFAFNIDDTKDGQYITPAGCSSTEKIVYSYPVFGSMMGGEKVYLSGPCWEQGNVDTTLCRFSTQDVNPLILHIANGTVETNYRVYCVPEPFFMVGEIYVEVSSDNGESWEFKGHYRLVDSARLDDEGKVTRQSSSSTSWNTAGNSLTITWPEDQFDANVKLEAHVLAYKEDGTDTGEGPRWEEVYTIATSMNNVGSFTFVPNAVVDVQADNAFGVIRVQPNNRGLGRKLYSDNHALGYILEESYQNNPVLWSNEKCTEWGEMDDGLGNIYQNLLACPCTLDQALADSGRFQPDTGCSMFAGSICTYHKGAKHCVRSVFPSYDNAGTQCCYDTYGNLMYARDTDEGSTFDRSHVWGSQPYLEANLVPALSHWKHDVITFYYCCLWGTECRTYLTRRYTVDCAAYHPPKPAITFGDPHFITFDGANFTFNGKGEFTLLDTKTLGGFRLDGRMEVIPAVSGTVESPTEGATGLTALVMFEEDSNALQVEVNAATGMAVYRGQYDQSTVKVTSWEVEEFRGQTWLDFHGLAITVNSMETDGFMSSITVMFHESEIGLNITRAVDSPFLSVVAILPPIYMDKFEVGGLMGDWTNDTVNDLDASDGTSFDLTNATEGEIYNASLKWETKEPSVFRYKSERSHDYYQQVGNYTPVFMLTVTEEDLSSSQRAFLENTCADFQQCRYDYLLTLNDGLATGTAMAAEHFMWAVENMEKIVACAYFPTPRNGTKVYQVPEEEANVQNNFVGTMVSVECSEGSTLTGSPVRTCQADGTYSGLATENECIDTPCGTLETVQHGSISITMFDGIYIAMVTCDEGYNMEGNQKHECRGGSWTGGVTKCLTSKSSSSVAGIVVGSIFGAIALIAICVVAGYFGWKEYKKPKNIPKTAKPQYYEKTDPQSPYNISQISLSPSSNTAYTQGDDFNPPAKKSSKNLLNGNKYEQSNKEGSIKSGDESDFDRM